MAKTISVLTCECGASFGSIAALSVHRCKAHNIYPVVHRYADTSNQCRACLTQFSTYQGVREHLQRGSPICLLNILLRVPPKSDAEDKEDRAVAAAIARINKRGGHARYLASEPATRAEGPLWKFMSLDCGFIDDSCKQHPCGPGKRKKVSTID